MYRFRWPLNKFVSNKALFIGNKIINRPYSFSEAKPKTLTGIYWDKAIVIDKKSILHGDEFQRWGIVERWFISFCINKRKKYIEWRKKEHEFNRKC